MRKDLKRPETFYLTCFFNWANPGLFFVYFDLLIITIFTTDQCEKTSCPFSIWRWDLNPQPSEHEPPPITNRPVLPTSTTLTWLQVLWG